MMAFDDDIRPHAPRRPSIANSTSSGRSSPAAEHFRPRQASDAPRPSASIPVIRTQKPSPQDPRPRKPGSQDPQDSNGSRNWAELASFMRSQREKGYNEIRAPNRGVTFKDSDSAASPSSGRSTPSLPRPSYPSDRSRSNSPSSLRAYYPNRYIDDEDWSRPPRASPRIHDGGSRDDIDYNRRPRRPSLNTSSSSRDLRAQALEPPPRRRGHDIPSPLPFGARGDRIKPNGGTPDPPPVPVKDEKRDKRRMRLPEDRKKEATQYELGLGVQNYGIKERTTRVA